MTVTSEVSRSGPYNGNGATTVFPYEFKIFAAADLLVTEVDLDGVETTLIEGTDYTVDGVLSDDGGDVTLTTALTGDGTDSGSHKLTIRRVLDATQTMNLRSQGKISAEVLERACDRAVMLIQQLADENARSIRLPESEVGGSHTILPSAAARALRGLAFDADGNLIAGSAPSSGVISSAMQPVTMAATLAAGRLAMEISDAVSVKDYGAIGDGVADDTDAIEDALAAANAAGGGVVTLPVGTFKITRGLTIPRNVGLVGQGMGASIIDGSAVAAGDHVGQYLLTTADTAHTALPAIPGALTRGANTITFASAPSLSRDDVLVLYNPTDSSYSGFRTYYRAGEFCRVVSVVGNVVTVQAPLAASYGAGVLSAYRVNSTTATFRDFSIIGNSAAGVERIGFRLRFGKDCTIDRVASWDSTYAGIELSQCFATDVISCRAGDDHSNVFGGDYGLIVGNSQHVNVLGGYFTAARHAITMGGGSEAGAVPVRYVKVIGGSFCCTTNIAAINAHGCTEYVSWIGCDVLGGAIVGGDHITVAECCITSLGSDPLAVVSFTELRGTNISIRNNRLIYTPAAAVPGNRGFFVDCGGNSDVISPNTVVGGTIEIRGNRMDAPNWVTTGANQHGIALVNRAYAGADLIHVVIADNTASTPGELSGLIIRSVVSGAWGDIEIRGNRFGIIIANSITTIYSFQRFTVRDNRITGGATASSVGVLIGGAKHVTIAGNRGHDLTGSPWHAYGSVAFPTLTAEIADNIAHNFCTDAAASDKRSGFYLWDVTAAIVRNNQWVSAGATYLRRWTVGNIAEFRVWGNTFDAAALTTMNETAVTAKYLDWPTVRQGAATYNPASLADGAGATTTVTVTGAALGDFAEASFSLDLQGITMTAWVSAADTVSVRFQNESGGVLDLGSGTLAARVRKQ